MQTSKKESSDGSETIQDTQEKCEFLPKTETSEEDSEVLSLNLEPLQRLSTQKTPIRIPRNPHFTRKDVVNAFQQAFQLMGGVPRLALWGNENETEFYKLYARLLPSQASSALGESNTLKIEMAIKPGPLDQSSD